MAENSTSKGATLAKLVATVVLAGALAAGLVLPEVGGLGLAARNSADIINGLPDQLTINPPAGNTRVLAADGSLITEFYSNNRIPVTSDQIATVMKQAQVDIEDSRFYEHSGVDVQGTVRALATNLSAGSVKEGGSTLTQQLVKQTLLQTADTPAARQAATQQSVGRKIREARLAMGVDQKYSKDEILTRYLNTVYFGEGSYGVEAAAQKYFSTHAKDLTLAQAATLAGLVQSPSGDDPITNPQNATTRRNEVLRRMHDLKHVTDQQYQEAVATPVQVVEGQTPPNGCISAAIAPFFCDYVQGYLTGVLKISQSQLNGGGLTVKTTLQPDLQRSSDQSVLQHVGMGNKFAGVLDAVQPGTGHVLAMAINRQYGCKEAGCTSVNYNDVAQVGSGSTYKVFTAAAALSAGFGAHYTITAPQPYTSKVFKGYDSKGHFGPVVVQNDDPNYKATYDMTSALVASTNTYYVALEDALGSITPGVQISQAMGMHYDNPVTQDSAAKMIQHQFAGFTLGYNATNPLDLANAYATVAAGGTRCEPTPVTAVLDQNGQPLKDTAGKPYDTGDHCTPNAIAPGVANTLANMMVGVVSPAGTGRRAIIPGHTIGGKTGTTQDNMTAAFGGITPDYSLAILYFDTETNPKKKTPVGGVGGGVPASIYHDAMAPVLGSQPDHPFPPADPAVVAGTKGAGPGAYSGNDNPSSTTGSDAAGGDGGAAGGAAAPGNGNGNGNGNG